MRFFDNHFRRLGGINPDAYSSCKQLSPEYCRMFNEKNHDIKGVYYQSYAAEMKSFTSNALLSMPFIILKWISGNNDGLVNIESAK